MLDSVEYMLGESPDLSTIDLQGISIFYILFSQI